MEPAPGASVLKIGSRRLHLVIGAADHHAIAALKPPDAAAGADVDIIDAFRHQLMGAADIVDIVGIAAVDDRVASFERRQEIGDRLVDDRGGNHEPDRARLLQLLGQVGERGAADRLFLDEFLDGLGRHVEDHAFMAVGQEPADHVGAHPPESDHSKLHDTAPSDE